MAGLIFCQYSPCSVCLGKTRNSPLASSRTMGLWEAANEEMSIPNSMAQLGSGTAHWLNWKKIALSLAHTHHCPPHYIMASTNVGML